MRGTDTVGYVLTHDAEAGPLQRDLDYVTATYWDLTPGIFSFERLGEQIGPGYRRVVTPAGGLTTTLPLASRAFGFTCVGQYWVKELRTPRAF